MPERTEEAKISAVKRIFCLFAEGWSLVRIAELVNEEEGLWSSRERVWSAERLNRVFSKED